MGGAGRLDAPQQWRDRMMSPRPPASDNNNNNQRRDNNDDEPRRRQGQRAAGRGRARRLPGLLKQFEFQLACAGGGATGEHRSGQAKWASRRAPVPKERSSGLIGSARGRQMSGRRRGRANDCGRMSTRAGNAAPSVCVSADLMYHLRSRPASRACRAEASASPANTMGAFARSHRQACHTHAPGARLAVASRGRCLEAATGQLFPRRAPIPARDGRVTSKRACARA